MDLSGKPKLDRENSVTPSSSTDLRRNVRIQMTSTVGIAFIQVEFIGAGALAIGDIRLFRSKRYRIYFREEFLGETRGCLWVVQALL